MNPRRQLHPWDVTPQEAVAIQQRLREQVITERLASPIDLVAGCDISYDKGSDIIFSGIVVLRLPDLIEVSRSTAITRVKFPYVPGLLSFRESPPVLEAWSRLEKAPDALMIDGHGFAHPRRFGIACHLGLLLNLPTVGCAKSLLIGRFEEPDLRAGCYSPLVDREETIGAVLRTEDNVNPVFVSIGHRVTLEDAIQLVMKCTKGYRIPEPTRQAHLLVNALRRGDSGASGSQPVQESLF
jgi:deoxyribonuclease V